jgi:AcrR family transcriptional regulator
MVHRTIRRPMSDAAQGSRAPKGPDRRERRRVAMIGAARALFLERGFDAVGLGEIVARSGGSLSTLYALFGNKAGLLCAIVEADRFECLERMAETIGGSGEPAPILRAAARELYDHFTDSETIGLIRLVTAEALRDPPFAHVVYRAAHEPSLELLAGLFARWDAAGKVGIPEPRLAAHFFIGLVVHGAQTRALFNDPCDHPRPSVDHVLDEAVRIFLIGYAPAES